jgi:hypothetical protein
MDIKRMLAIAVVTVLLVPSAAYAQSGTEGYGGQQNVVAGLEEDSAPPPSAPAPAGKEVAPAKADRGALPFTGADLGVLMAAGSVLLALGFGLRRLTHRPFQV